MSPFPPTAKPSSPRRSKRATRFVRLGLLFLAALTAAPAFAEVIVSSAGPERTALTVYRDPNRAASQALNSEWLNGYALISEVRTVSLPAGPATIRFEGVAGGIVPESAIVTGLAQGVVEKNQDADLLSPGSLLDRSLGRRVRIRRTSRTTSKVSEDEAVIRTGADGGVVLHTAAGFEALRCSGLPETIVYDELPEGLSAKPTLSVRVESVRAATATVTLSYLASGFDWQANYVGNLSADGKRMDLFAWLTLANGDETGFRDAETQAVAGRVNREQEERRQRPEGRELRLQCWPAARTSDIEERFPPEPAPPAMAYYGEEGGEDIVVTGSRVMAKQEELGDLKLYRIPERVTVAAFSQKQVALLEKKAVQVTPIYRARVNVSNEGDPRSAARVYRTRNQVKEGLGLPLPGGRIAMFMQRAGRPVLVGEGFIEDRAVGEDVDVEVSQSTGVNFQIVEDGDSEDANEQKYRMLVTNDLPHPVDFEAVLLVYGGYSLVPRIKLAVKDGRPAWRARIPANGRASLSYVVTEAPESDKN